MKDVIPTHGTLQLSGIYNSPVWCYMCSSHFYVLFDSIFGLTIFFRSLFSSCVLCIIIRSVLWLHMTLSFPYGYLILLYIWLELYVCSVFKICNSFVDFRKYSFILIALVNQQGSVQNTTSSCPMYKFKATRLQHCKHEMLMCF